MLVLGRPSAEEVSQNAKDGATAIIVPRTISSVTVCQLAPGSHAAASMPLPLQAPASSAQIPIPYRGEAPAV